MLSRTNWCCYVIKQLFHGFSCASIELWMHKGGWLALKKLGSFVSLFPTIRRGQTKQTTNNLNQGMYATENSTPHANPSPL